MESSRPALLKLLAKLVTASSNAAKNIVNNTSKASTVPITPSDSRPSPNSSLPIPLAHSVTLMAAKLARAVNRETVTTAEYLANSSTAVEVGETISACPIVPRSREPPAVRSIAG